MLHIFIYSYKMV